MSLLFKIGDKGTKWGHLFCPSHLLWGQRDKMGTEGHKLKNKEFCPYVPPGHRNKGYVPLATLVRNITMLSAAG